VTAFYKAVIRDCRPGPIKSAGIAYQRVFAVLNTLDYVAHILMKTVSGIETWKRISSGQDTKDAYNLLSAPLRYPRRALCQQKKNRK
jgi:hypothetical protein